MIISITGPRRNLRNDLLVAADSITNTVSSLVKELHSGMHQHTVYMYTHTHTHTSADALFTSLKLPNDQLFTNIVLGTKLVKNDNKFIFIL